MNSDALYFTVIAAGVAAAALLFAAGLKKRSLRPVHALPLMAAGLLAAFVTGKLFWLLFTSSQPAGAMAGGFSVNTAIPRRVASSAMAG